MKLEPCVIKNNVLKAYLSNEILWVSSDDPTKKIFKTKTSAISCKNWLDNRFGLPNNRLSVKGVSMGEFRYHRAERVSIVEWHRVVEGALLAGKEKIKYKDFNIKVTSDRYQTFIYKGIVCVGCGLEALHYWIEQHRTTKAKKWHLNLYGLKDVEEIMITKDHIIPKSKGGVDLLENYQTMCEICNQKKGNTI